MTQKRKRSGARASYASFVGINRSVADSAAFKSLPPLARALYVDLRRQFKGFNNGDICAADGILRVYGWSHSTIHKLLPQLIKHGLLIKTRQGGIASMSKIPSLYAFTDEQINEFPAKGIKGSPPSLAYRDFTPPAKSKRTRKKHLRIDSKVHAVDFKVHGIDLHRSTG